MWFYLTKCGFLTPGYSGRNGQAGRAYLAKEVLRPALAVLLVRDVGEGSRHGGTICIVSAFSSSAREASRAAAFALIFFVPGRCSVKSQVEQHSASSAACRSEKSNNLLYTCCST